MLILFIYEQIRDYIHVMDLADGHVAAVRKLFTADNIGDCLHLYMKFCFTPVLAHYTNSQSYEPLLFKMFN